MKRQYLAIGCTISLACSLPACMSLSTAQAPNIEGTYRLVSRTLPDGRVQKPPEAMGLVSFSKTHRNMSIMLRDASGKHFSLSQVSEYKLSAGEYTETLLYQMVNNEIAGKGITYDSARRTQSSPVKTEGGRIQFQLPFEAPTVTFEQGKMTAATPKGPVAVWEKVQ